MPIPRGVAKDTLLLLVLTTFGVKRNDNEKLLFITVKEAGISSLTGGKCNNTGFDGLYGPLTSRKSPIELKIGWVVRLGFLYNISKLDDEQMKIFLFLATFLVKKIRKTGFSPAPPRRRV